MKESRDMRIALSILLLLAHSALHIHAQTVSALMSPLAWTVDTSAGSPVCSQASCCCFTGAVNSYTPAGDLKLYLNGTVAGVGCNGAVKQDNLDPPSAFDFPQEFWQIDYRFQLKNSSGGRTLIATSSARPACGFAMFAAASPLPAVPAPNPTPAPVPVYAQVWLGKWDFATTTCHAQSACCCFVGPATISVSPLGTNSFFITGVGSAGCQSTLSKSKVQDDFPFPTAAAARSVTIGGFLRYQNNYQVTLDVSGAVNYTLTFNDTTTPVCSMQATMLAPQLPKMPASWTATVSANFHNSQPANYYTLAYNEAYDATANVYTTQGRFADAQQTDVFFFNAGSVFSYNKRAPDATCTFTGWASYPNQRMVRPSTLMFDALANGTLVYVGRTVYDTSQTQTQTYTEARNILCDKWLVTQFSPFNNMSYAYTIYFAVGTTPGQDQVPVRVELTGTNAAGQDVHKHTYDWTNWVSGAPPATVYALPANCRQAPPHARLPLPHNNSMAGAPPPPATMPPLVQQFTVTLEGKMDTDTDDAVESNDRVYTVVWSVDTSVLSERYDFYLHSEAGNRASPTLVDSYIFKYTPGTPWGTQGLKYRALLNASRTQYTGCSTASGYFDEKNESPLHNVRAGSLSAVLTQPALFLANSNCHYVGATLARGVTADTYRSVHLGVVNDGVKYDYVTDMLLFPSGWAFPGRNITDPSARIPLRIINVGNQTNSSGTFEYKDIWDLFFFLPGAPDASRFDPTSIGCTPQAPAPAPPAEAYSRSAVIFSAVFGTVFGALFVSATGYLCYRRWRSENPAPAEPVELVNRE